MNFQIRPIAAGAERILASQENLEAGTVVTAVSCESSNGVLADLAGGEIREILSPRSGNTCPASPHLFCLPPPFSSAPLPNPGNEFIASGDVNHWAAHRYYGLGAESGSAIDIHGTYNVVAPFAQTEFAIHQVYEFVAPWAPPGAGYVGYPLASQYVNREIRLTNSGGWEYACRAAGIERTRQL